MPETPTTIARTPSPWPWLAVALFVGCVQGIWWLLVDDVVVRGAFADGDSYAHLVRALRLVETGAWFDSGLPRANAPFGDTLHWTRLFDVILIGLAMALTPALDFADALFWAGVMVSPLLHGLVALALVWATMPVLGPTGAFVAGALSAIQFAILNFASVGRADHHLLFALIGVLALGFMVRSLNRDDVRRSDAVAAGGLLALGLWVGPETLVFLALCLAASGLAWLTGEPGGATRNVRLTLGLTVGLAVVLLVERGPQGFAEVEYDRVSIVHLTLVLLLLGFWIASRKVKRGGRLVAGIAGVAVTGVVMRTLYPEIFLNPLDQVDPVVAAIFDRISEYASIGDTAHFLVYLGGAVFAVPWAVWRAKEEWRSPLRWAWVLIGGALIVYLALALDWIRWSLYAGLFLTIALADLIARVDGAVTARFAGRRGSWLRYRRSCSWPSAPSALVPSACTRPTAPVPRALVPWARWPASSTGRRGESAAERSSLRRISGPKSCTGPATRWCRPCIIETPPASLTAYAFSAAATKALSWVWCENAVSTSSCCARNRTAMPIS